MTDQDKSNHWDQLAHELGAAPRPEQREDEPAPTAEHTPAASEPVVPEPSPPETSPQEPAAEPQSTGTKWDALASDLGVVVPQPSTAEPAAEEQPHETTPGQASGEETAIPSGGDAAHLPPNGHGDEISVSISASADEKPVQDARALDDTEPIEARPKRERRRRSPRRRKKSPLPSEGQAKPAAANGQGKPAAEDDSPPDEAGKGSPKPKRSAAKTKKSSERQADQDRPAKDSKVARSSHRAIPTWEEAIGLIVSANLEARAKRPGSGSAQGRNRGRRPKKTPGSAKGPESGKKKPSKKKS